MTFRMEPECHVSLSMYNYSLFVQRCIRIETLCRHLLQAMAYLETNFRALDLRLALNMLIFLYTFLALMKVLHLFLLGSNPERPPPKHVHVHILSALLTKSYAFDRII